MPKKEFSLDPVSWRILSFFLQTQIWNLIGSAGSLILRHYYVWPLPRCSLGLVKPLCDVFLSHFIFISSIFDLVTKNDRYKNFRGYFAQFFPRSISRGYETNFVKKNE